MVVLGKKERNIKVSNYHQRRLTVRDLPIYITIDGIAMNPTEASSACGFGRTKTATVIGDNQSLKITGHGDTM